MGTLRQTIWGVDPNVPIPSVTPLDTVLATSASEARLMALLFGAFGVLALSLGAVGVYGVMAYVVGTRESEWGLRLALGAAPASVRGLAVRLAAVPLATGIVVGLLVAAGSARLLEALLYGVRPLDPLTFLLVPLVLGGVAMLATYIPARRAGRVDPMSALASE